MRTIAMVSAKGGSGKTSLSAALAVAAHEAGEKVFAVDLDPQGSLYSWGERRQAEEPPVDRIDPARLSAALDGLKAAGFTLVIVDTAGHDSPATAAAMKVADLCLIPARPSALDIEAARPTMGALSRLGRPFAFVLNACPTGRTSRPSDAGKALGLLGVLAQPFITQRADHVDAMGFGLGVTELGAGKAGEEIRALWSWIRRKMDGSAQIAA